MPDTSPERPGVAERADSAPKSAASDGGGGGPKRSPRRRLTKNTKLTVAVIAVAVAAVAGVSLWTWSEDPSFCSALCHSPLAAYVDGYYSDDAGLGVTVHADADLTCLSCHDSSTVRQIGEFAHWVTDSYQVDEDAMLVKDETMLTAEFCLRDGCHTWESVVDSTWGFAGNDESYNPHASHQDASITCSDCHSIHGQNQLYCAKCHSLELPEGWVATGE